MAKSDEPEARDHGERTIISEREKPVLDEAMFQQLLEAAHVLQEQKGTEVGNQSGPDPAEALAEILETQEFLRSQPGDLQVGANVVVQRLQKITHATGVAVAVVRENRLEYCAATGDAARLAGTSLPMDSSLSSDGLLSTEFSGGHAGKHSIALPLQHDGKLTGLLEIRFADAGSIPAPEIRSCQLMAGLMTEAIARAADQEWRQTLAAERAAMLEALERIKPQLERLAVGPTTNVAVPEEEEHVAEPAEAHEGISIQVPLSEASAKSGRGTACPQCGYQFGEQELFCGRCGTARPDRISPSVDLPGKWAPLRLGQPAEIKHGDEADLDPEQTESIAPAVADPRLSLNLSYRLSPASSDETADLSHKSSEPDDDAAEDTPPPISPALREGKKVSPWASATQAHQWLESLHPKSAGGIWLAKHRADVYVGAAVVVLLIVLSGWGMRPAESHGPVKSAPQPSLTLFEKLLVNLGLAETPPTPVYLGNPNAPVWVDLHTALYYCSDSDLYGKTPGGRFTTQRDAQMDQFEPAARRNCE